MPKLTDEQLLAVVDAEFQSAMGAPDGEISTERARAWDFYLSKKLGNEVDGESQVVTSDVSDVVDGHMPSFLRILTTADNLCSFDAVGEEDEEAAAQESDYVNHVFFKENPAFLILYTWMFDAEVQKNGITKAWWDDSERVTTETYEDLTEAELFELLDDDEIEPIERSERTETIETPLGPQELTLHSIKVRRVSKEGRCRVDNVPPEQYRISSDSRSLDPSGARMVGQERDDVTRSELLEMGFDPDIVDDLPAHGNVHESPEEISRRNKTDEKQDTPHDRSQDKILVREAYIKVDYDGDGRSELRQIITAGNVVLSNEEADRQPFHVISPQPLPHKHFGRASADKVVTNQEVTTTLLRQTLNNLYHSNQPGHAVWEQGIGDTTLDDLLTTRVGRVATFRRPVGESYAPMTVPFTAGASFPMLEWFDKDKRDKTGINSDGEGLSPDALKNIQTSVMAQANDLSRMKIEAIVRIFAETGIKSLFLHIHELLLKHQRKEKVVKLRGDYVKVNPSHWRTRTDMTVNIGLGIGTREQNLLHLESIWAKQKDMAEGGGMNLTVTPKNIFRTASEFVKNARLQDPALYFTDPGDKKAPPPSDQQLELQKQQQDLMQRQQMLDARDQQQAQQKIALQAREQAQKHDREMRELQRKIEKDKDDFIIAMDDLRNDIAKMNLQFNANVPEPQQQ